MAMKTTASIDAYIKDYPKDIQRLLRKLRSTIKKSAPKAVETIKYGMPTFVLVKNLVHFAAYKGHIGFYPTPSAIVHFKKEIAKYQWSKGAVQFPIDQPIPVALVTKMVKFRVSEVTRVKVKKKKKK